MGFVKEFFIGPDQVRAFADLVGDHNPVHLDAEFARTTKYGGPICHGMLVASFISGCLVEALGQGTVYVEQSVRFRRPVPVGSRIRVLLGEPEAAPKGQSLLTTVIEVQQGEIWKKVLEGQATVISGGGVGEGAESPPLNPG
jgi:3-hydroxybutyryl-CoA dehydratase